MRLLPLLPAALAVAPASTRSISVSVSTVAIAVALAGGTRFIRSRQGTATSIVFLLQFSLDIIIVALFFVVVKRRNFEGFIARTDLMVVVITVVAST